VSRVRFALKLVVAILVLVTSFLPDRPGRRPRPRVVLTGLVLAVAIVAVGCHSSDPIRTANGSVVHWRSTTSGDPVRRITVVVPAAHATSSTMQAVNAAVQQANRTFNVRLAIHVPATLPATCKACIFVTRGPLPYPTVAKTSFGYDSNGHMYGIAARVVLDNSRPHGQQVLNNAGCHEIAGHGLGLAHANDGSPGPCREGRLTSHDLGLLNKAHAHADRIT
jgi:hypothetical protein